jgi:hypothetical protein
MTVDQKWRARSATDIDNFSYTSRDTRDITLLYGERQKMALKFGPRVTYGYVPPSQAVHSGSQVLQIPAGEVHQTAWTETAPPNIRGVYANPQAARTGCLLGGGAKWQPMVWRWADTMRSNAIKREEPAPSSPDRPGSFPAYRVEVAPTDKASPGTSGNNPRAELLSVDNEEKHRRQQPPDTNVLRDGDEYWATFALFIPTGFPTNHRWATLFQRKLQDVNVSWASWVTLNVHGTTVDVSIPGNTPDLVQPVASLSDLIGRWTQFTVHEKLSSSGKGVAEFYVETTQGLSISGASTIPAGDVLFHFQFGYYRTNDPIPGQHNGPDLGVVYYTPMLIKRDGRPGQVPRLP